MPIKPRPEVEDLSLCPHGSVTDAELEALGLARGEVIDFSVNTNPLGPPPGLATDLSLVDLSRYPDPNSTQLTLALSQKLSLPTDHILVSNGSVELIWLAAMAFLRPEDEVVILGPTFGEYETASRIAGGVLHFFTASTENDFGYLAKEAAAFIAAHRPRMVFLCNPNNPTGAYLGQAEVATILSAATESLLVVDEAYLSFVASPDSLVGLLPHHPLLLLRSMTKDYALAGVRLGYALASSEIIASLRKVQPPWSVNVLAQRVGLAVLGWPNHPEAGRREAERAKSYLASEMARLGFRVVPSAANFFLMEVGNAPSFRLALLRRGCCLRDCSSFGLPQFIRIGVGTLAQCQRLVAVVKEVAYG